MNRAKTHTASGDANTQWRRIAIAFDFPFGQRPLVPPNTQRNGEKGFWRVFLSGEEIGRHNSEWSPNAYSLNWDLLNQQNVVDILWRNLYEKE